MSELYCISKYYKIVLLFGKSCQGGSFPPRWESLIGNQLDRQSDLQNSAYWHGGRSLVSPKEATSFKRTCSGRSPLLINIWSSSAYFLAEGEVLHWAASSSAMLRAYRRVSAARSKRGGILVRDNGATNTTGSSGYSTDLY